MQDDTLLFDDSGDFDAPTDGVFEGPDGQLYIAEDWIGDVLYHAASCDWITPTYGLLRGGVTLFFEPPPGRSANDVQAHLKKQGIDSWALHGASRHEWTLRVAKEDADRAEAILRNMR